MTLQIYHGSALTNVIVHDHCQISQHHIVMTLFCLLNYMLITSKPGCIKNQIMLSLIKIQRGISMNSINQFWNWWTKPSSKDEELTQREYTIRAVLFFLTFTCLVYLLFTLVGWLANIFNLAGFITTLVVSVAIGILDFLTFRGTWKLVNYLLPGLFWLVALACSILYGYSCEVALVHILAGVLSMILIDKWIAWLLYALGVSAYTFIGWIIAAGFPKDKLVSVFGFTLASFSIMLLVRFIRRQLEGNLESIHTLSVNLQREMSAHKQAEVEKQQLAEAYRFTLHNMEYNLFRLKKNLKGEIVYALNEGRIPQKAGRTTGVVFGKTLIDFAGEPEAQKNIPYYARAFRGETVIYDTEINGKTYSVILTPIEVDGKVNEVVGRSYDITGVKQIEEEKIYLSTHDPLTGLFNRPFFDAQMERLQYSQNYPISVLMADIDILKTINEQLGRSAGDELLRRTAQVLREAFRREDLISRIGGDEFAVLLSGSGESVCHLVMTRLKTSLAKYNLEHRDLPLELSVGIATGEEGESILKVFNLANQRMTEEQAAKRKLRSTS